MEHNLVWFPALSLYRASDRVDTRSTSREKDAVVVKRRETHSKIDTPSADALFKHL